MMMRGFLLSFLLAVLGTLPGGAVFAAPSGAFANNGLSVRQWEEVFSQFEGSVLSLSRWLEENRREREGLRAKIQKLESRTAALRQQIKKKPSVIDEIRLKGLLGDLKELLEKDSASRHEREGKERDFQQKALSLIALYNDRVKAELEAGDAAQDPSRLDAQLTSLTALVRKRQKIQALLAVHGSQAEPERPLPVAPLDGLRVDDRESLQLTLGLLGDRKKDIQEQVEKWAIEEEEVRNEMRLQGKMREFLSDLQKLNEDSNLPRGGFGNSDLESVAGRGQRGKLAAHLSQLKERTVRAQKTLLQIDQLTAKLRNQLDTLKEGKRK